MTTSTLQTRARAGDPEAFGALIRRWDGDLRGVAWSVVRSGSATDDVMQVAYERAFRSIDRFDGRASMKTWLHSIVYRTAIDHLRYEGRRRHDEIDSLLGTSATDPGTERAAVTRAELDAVLDDCSPDQRAMLMLVAADGYSIDEAAEILEIPRGTVASRLSRIRKRLSRWEDT